MGIILSISTIEKGENGEQINLDKGIEQLLRNIYYCVIHMYNRDRMEPTAIPTKFTRKDIDLMDEFVKEGYFSTRSDLVRTSVRHYLHELSSLQIKRKIPQKRLSKDDVETELKEIRKVRKKLWEKKNV